MRPLMTDALRAALVDGVVGMLARFDLPTDDAAARLTVRFVVDGVTVGRCRNHGGWATVIAHHVTGAFPALASKRASRELVSQLAALADTATKAAKHAARAAHGASPVTRPAD